MLRTSLVVLVLASVAFAQPDERLQLVLDRVTNTEGQAPETLRAHLSALTQDEISALCAMIVVPGEGDDTAPRMALQALTLNAAGNDAAKQRHLLCDVLSAELAAQHPVAVKQFFLRQLQLIGDERVVTPVSALLDEDELALTATQTLVAIGGDEARAALREALPNVPEPTRIAIINALGALRDADAADEIVARLGSDNPDEMWAALNALAAMGVETSRNDQIKGIDPSVPHDRARLVNVLLLAARRLATNGQRDTAADILRSAYFSGNPNVGSHERCAILSSLAEAAGVDAIEVIVDALHGDDAELRAAARDAAIGINNPKATEMLAAEYQRASTQAAIELLTILAARRDAAATSCLQQALDDQDQQVRIAAIDALGTLGGGDAIDALVGALKNAENAERDAIQKALIAMQEPNVATTVANTLPTVDPSRRAALLDVLAVRGTGDQLGAIRRCLRDEDEQVRIAAVGAFGAIADWEQASVLLTRLTDWAPEELREAMIDALSEVCRRGAPTARTAAQPILEQLSPEDIGCYVIQLRVLGRLGSSEALDVIAAAAGDERTAVAEAAMRALADWPTGNAAQLALDMAQATEDTKLHVLGMRAFARMMPKHGQVNVGNALHLFRTAMMSARRIEEKRLLLSRLADIAEPQALEELVGFVNDGALRQEATAAVLRCADSLLPGHWAAVRDALNEVLATPGLADEQRTSAEDLLARANEYGEYIVEWMMAGPYTQEGTKGLALYDVPFPPETPGDTSASWKLQRGGTDPRSYWYLDLAQQVGGADRAVYLRTKIHSDHAQPVLIELGSDDGVKVWLNDEFIHGINMVRGCAPAQDKLQGQLREGWNDLLLKVVNQSGGWGACARLRAPDGSSLQGVVVDPEGDAAIADNAGAADESWEPLFNGIDLTGWQCPPGSWKVVDEQLTCAGGGYIWTEEEYGDFDLELEFKIPPSGNSGIFFRTANIDDPVQTGMEYQIYDTYGWDPIRKNHCGAIYGCMGPSKQLVRAPGEWNQARLRCTGPIIQSWLNGELVVEMDLQNWTEAHRNPDGTENKFNTPYCDMPRTGHIGLQDHGQPVWFRNMRIRRLD